MINNIFYIIYYIYDPVFRPRGPPPEWDGSPFTTPPSLLFAGFCSDSDLDDLRSTNTASKYLRATYSHIYMCYVATSYIYIYTHTHTHTHTHIHTYISI